MVDGIMKHDLMATAEKLGLTIGGLGSEQRC